MGSTFRVWSLALGSVVVLAAYGTVRADDVPPPGAGVEQLAPPSAEAERRQEVRLVDGAFEVLLDHEVSAEATAWLWLESGRLDGPDRVQPVAARRHHAVRLRACGGDDAPYDGRRCARVIGLADLGASAGRYAASLRVDPAGLVQELTIYVAPDALVLWGFLVAGLLLSFLATTLARRVLERLRRRRRLDRLEARLGSTREDHPPLLARIKGLLALARIGLRRRVFGADPEALDRYLDEAEQLLRLAEAKTRVWQRTRALFVPPSLAQQINAELRLFDDEVLQLDLPLPPDKLEALRLPPLERANALLESAALCFARDLGGALADALAETDGPGPALAADGGAESVAAMIADQIALERARLERLAATPADERSPLQLREADLRLTILRACREALARGPEALEALDARLVAEALTTWRTVQDQLQSAADRAFEAVLYALRWQPENARFQRWLEAFLARGTLFIEAEPAWQTFTPCPVRVELAALVGTRYADTFLWRRLLEVAWRALDEQGRPVRDLAVIGTPLEGAADEGDGWVVVQGPETSVYCTRAGRYRIEARIRPPDGGPWRPVVQPLTVSVTTGPEHRFSVVVSLLSDVRLTAKLLVTLLAGLVLIEEARRDPHGLTTYTGLFYAAVGAAIDLGTTAVPRGFEAAAGALRAFLAGRRGGAAL